MEEAPRKDRRTALPFVRVCSRSRGLAGGGCAAIDGEAGM